MMSLFVNGAIAQTNTCKWVYAMPVYPGMEPAGAFASKMELHLPSITRFKAYKTKVGVKVDPDDVISFYKDFYATLGWKLDPDCSHLHMEINSADLQLWISPDGELLTMYMDEYRSIGFNLPSDPFKQYRNTFETVAEQNNLFIQKVYEFGWEEYYENENLKTCELYTFYQDSWKSAGLSRCTDSSEHFSALILLYLNEQAAKEQKEKWDSEAAQYKHKEIIDNGDGSFSHIMRSWWNQVVIQEENILIRIENGDKNQTNLISKVASEIENFSNNNVIANPTMDIY